MCRLLGIVASPHVDLGLLEAFAELAVTGNTPEGGPDARGHADGWGLAVFRDGALVDYARGLGAANHDARFREHARSLADGPAIVIAHLRRASEKMPVSPRWSHPFVETRGGRTWAFAHNGGLTHYVFDEEDGLIDSQVLFREILAHLDGPAPEDVARATAAMAETAKTVYGGYSALDFLMTDGTRLHAFREFAASERNEAYYTLNHGRADASVIICSETTRGVAGTEVPKGVLLSVNADGSFFKTQVL